MGVEIRRAFTQPKYGGTWSKFVRAYALWCCPRGSTPKMKKQSYENK